MADRTRTDPLELATWINPAYLHTPTLRQLRTAFLKSEPHALQLREFLRSTAYRAISHGLKQAKFVQQRIPDQFSYAVAKQPFPPALTAYTRFLRSRAFRELLFMVTGQHRRLINVAMQRFGHRDYTLLNQKAQEQRVPKLELSFDCTPNWQSLAGGYTSYATEQVEVFRVVPQANVLTIMQRPVGVKRFVKYVNHHVGRSQRQLLQIGYR